MGEAEVGDFAAAAAGEHEVRRFDVAVDDAVLMAVVEGFGGFGAELGGAEAVHGAGGFDELVEVAAFDEFHRDVVDAGDGIDFVNGDDAGMFQRRGASGFAIELVEFVGFVSLSDFLGEDFESDVAFEGDVFGAEDFAHGSLAEDGEELEMADHAAFPGRGGGFGDIDAAGRGERITGTTCVFVGQRRLQSKRIM